MKKGMKKGNKMAMIMKQVAVIVLILVAFVAHASAALAATLTVEPSDITPGVPVDINGTGFTPDGTVTVTTTVICWKPVVDGKCECTMEDFELPENTSFTLSVREVEDNVTLYIKKIIWWQIDPGLTSFFTFEYTSYTSNVTSGKIPAALAGIYSIDVIGDTVTGEENCTMITTAEFEVTADETGNFSVEDVNTQGIPICNFSITATDGTNSAGAALNITMLGDPSKDGRESAYDCTCIARYWAEVGGYDNSTVCRGAAAGLAPPCDQVTLDDARCLARYLIGKESSIPCAGCP